MAYNRPMKQKEIIFFDGDGTLWYPKSTKRTISPHWIYSDVDIGKRYLDHMVLTPSALAILKKLKRTGVLLIVLSTHPHLQKEADGLLARKVRHFKLENILTASLVFGDSILKASTTIKLFSFILAFRVEIKARFLIFLGNVYEKSLG